MYRKLLITCLLTILIGGVCFAEKNFTIQVSAAIPAIPGVNTPFLIKEEWLTKDNYEPRVKTEESNITQNKNILKEETKKNTKEEKPKAILMKTFYVR